MKQRISIIVLIATALLSLLALYIMLNLSSPSAVGPVGVLFVFSAIYILTFSSLTLTIRVTEIVYRLILPSKTAEQTQVIKSSRQKKTNLIAAALSLVPIFLISLNSIGELGFIDIALIIATEALLIFYISKKN